jgi:hypothetical protein
MIIFGSSGVNDSAGAKIGDFLVEYLGEFEAICKKASTRLSGAQVGLFDEKNPRSKISWHYPFKLIQIVSLFKALEILYRLSRNRNRIVIRLQ